MSETDVTNAPAGLASWAAMYLNKPVAYRHDDGAWYTITVTGRILPRADAPAELFFPADEDTDTWRVLADRVAAQLRRDGFDLFEERHVIGGQMPWSVRIGRVEHFRAYAMHTSMGKTFTEAFLKAARHAVNGPMSVPLVEMRWTDDEHAASAKTAGALEMQRVVRQLFKEPPGEFNLGSDKMERSDEQTAEEWRKFVEERVAQLAPVTIAQTADDGDPPKVSGYDDAIIGKGKVLDRTVWVYDFVKVARIAGKDVAHQTREIALDVTASIVNFEFGKDRGPRSPVLLLPKQ